MLATSVCRYWRKETARLVSLPVRTPSLAASLSSGTCLVTSHYYSRKEPKFPVVNHSRKRDVPRQPRISSFHTSVVHLTGGGNNGTADSTARDTTAAPQSSADGRASHGKFWWDYNLLVSDVRMLTGGTYWHALTPCCVSVF